MVPAVVGGVLVLVIGVALLALATRASDTVLAAQLAADHAKCFAIFAAAGAEPVDAHRVEQTLASSYGWDIHVPPSSEREGVQLIGGRRCLYGEGRIPHLMYKVRGQNLSLYVLEGVARGTAELSTFGQHSRIWSRGTNTFVLVSQAGRELDDAARYVMREAR
jgi:anti-sigma factor RsiW